jgi:SAM-dependent methyltransferase
MFIENYDNPIIHRRMLRDRVRCEAYKRAIQHAVRAGDVVADLGAGTGILSIFAAQAGAKKVYAVEPTSTIAVAHRLIAQNGLADRIELIQDYMETVRLPEKVDVITSEWIGSFGNDENLLAGVLLARDRWLKPGGRLLPQRVSAWLGLVQDPKLDAEMDFWRSYPYDSDLGLMGDRMADEVLFIDHDLGHEHLLAPPQEMWYHDAIHTTHEDAQGPCLASLRFVATQARRLSALAAWFESDLLEGHLLTNRPGAPKTHWRLALFPFTGQHQLREGTEVNVEFCCAPAGPGFCHVTWGVQVGQGEWERHDTRRLAAGSGPAPRAFLFSYNSR